MHILLLTPTYPNGFDETVGIFYRDQADALAAAGHQVGVLAVVPISLKTMWARRNLWIAPTVRTRRGVNAWVVTLPSVPKARRLNSRIRRPLARGLLARYVARHGSPDVLHAHCSEVGDVALDAKVRLRVPYVLTEHSSAMFRAAKLPAAARRAYAGASARLAVSEALAGHLADLSGLPFEFVPNVVDLDRFGSSRAPATTAERPFVFCSIGSLTPVKNHALLLGAYAAAFRADERFELVIVGDGPGRQALVAQAATLGITARVRFLGALSREQVDAVLKDARCLVVSSRTETFGVVLIEAMAAGLPVVATRCGGPESIVTSADVGILVDQTTAALAAGMIEVTQRQYDPSLLKATVAARFSAPIIARRLTAIFDEVLTRR